MIYKMHNMKRRALLIALLLATVNLGIVAPAAARSICATMGATQYVYQIHYCVTSVLPPQAGNDYGPENLFDHSNSTAWCEGVRGAGEGQRLSLYINDGGSFRRFRIWNGYQKSRSVFENNARPKTIEVSTDTGLRFQATLPNSMGETMVNLPAAGEYRELHIKVIDVYPGRKYSDSCINEIIVDFEYDELLFQQQLRSEYQLQPQQLPNKPVIPSGTNILEELEDLPDL